MDAIDVAESRPFHPKARSSIETLISLCTGAWSWEKFTPRVIVDHAVPITTNRVNTDLNHMNKGRRLFCSTPN